MKSFFRNLLATLFVFLLISNANIIAQTTEYKNTPTTLEKVYIHSDRDYYNLGENLWYKAYVVNAYNNVPINYSNVLYVELISEDSKIISKNKTLINSGLGFGDFKLTDSLGIKAGKYQLRAYTNWMRNFNNDFIFEKDIEIISLNDKNNTNNKQKNRKKTRENLETQIVTSKDSISVQFFPEGGFFN